MVLPSGNGQVFRWVFKSSPGVEVCWIVVPPAVTPSAVGGRWPARSPSLIPREQCSSLLVGR